MQQSCKKKKVLRTADNLKSTEIGETNKHRIPQFVEQAKGKELRNEDVRAGARVEHMFMMMKME